jgi:phosphoribosyl 1,2-cyclic phosphodiesterase
MELKVIGTGSAGNCYILENANTALIIEAGISFKEVKKALSFNITKIAGVLISHMHQDHSKYVKEYQNVGIKVYMSQECFMDLKISNDSILCFTDMCNFEIGDFKILDFKLEHDVDCYGYQIDHPEIGRLIFATDTKDIDYKFSSVNHWLIECNYSEKIIESRTIKDELGIDLMQRIVNNHMSLETLLINLEINNLKQTDKIILIHGSDYNSNSEEFKQSVIDSTGKDVYIAEKGLKLDLTKH